MANVFEDLALKYVLADDGDHDAKKAVAQEAVVQIEATTPTRVAIGQWVSSINRWMGSKSDLGEDDDIISRAKALDFLARTLELLRKDLLKPDQVKLLVGFFDSLFSSDHRAGIDASAKALRHLVTMKAFQPPLGNAIIMSISKLGGDDFKRQTPATRLEIYELIVQLLHYPLVAEDLAYQHGSTCGFMTALVDLCRNERDPTNLMKWFEIQKLFLLSFSPADEVTEEVFKVFSAYFPITLRASATPSGITVDDLKGAVRSCFSSHHRLARFAIPFLLNKLDQGEAVTVSVKVDILQTLEACLAQYEHVEQGVAPYADQIWTSLKYEVRNGEIRDAIEATLKTLGTLTKRLRGDDLQKFFAAGWIDLSDDISNASYTESAGRLLTAIAGASCPSFAISAQQTIPHIQKTLQQSTSTSHRTDLVAILNAFLLVRLALNEGEEVSELQDDLFGDFLFESLYSPLWLDWSKSQFTTDRPPIMLKLVDGLSSLVRQQSSDGSKRALCSESTRNRVFTWLGSPSITYPLEGKDFLLGTVQKEEEDLANAATRALANLAPLYPMGFQQLLIQFLMSINSIAESSAISAIHANLVLRTAARLSYIGCKTLSSRGSPIKNPVLLINTLLTGLHKVLRVSPLFWTSFINSIHLAVSMTTEALAEKLPGKHFGQIELSGDAAEQDWIEEVNAELNSLAENSKDHADAPQRIHDSIEKLSTDISAACQQFAVYSLQVLGHIYRRFVTLETQTEPVLGLSSDFETSTEVNSDVFLHQLGRMATTIVRPFGEDSQKKLQLDKEAFLLFSQPSTDATSEQVFDNLVVTHKENKDIWVICRGVCRTAPLSLGILQGLWPSVLTDLVRIRLLNEWLFFLACRTKILPNNHFDYPISIKSI
jgi:DNA repair/transcription protein MET18/MMS19